MPRYKVLATSYINDQLLPASTEAAPVFVDYDGNPGTNLEPTDDEGRKRQRAYFASKGKSPDQALHDARTITAGYAPRTPEPVTHHVAIPDDWESLEWPKLSDLAARLGAPAEATTKAAKTDFIKAEVERRAGLV